MAAPAKTDICARCFAHVKDTDLICPECGAPLKTDGSVQAADSAMHAELAQANLFRLRGDIDAAEKQCLSILKQFPNEPEAHSLLGEICADRGDIARAIEWYELALDLNPSSTKDRDRLNELKKLVQTQETAHIEEQLGLPPKTNSTLWIAGGTVILVLIIIAGAIANSGSRRPPNLETSITAPRVSSSSVSGGALDTSGGNANSVPAKPNAAAVTGALPMDDRAMMQILQQRSSSGAEILSLSQDPRDKALTVTYSVKNPEDARKTGAMLARDALLQSPDSLIVTVRGVSGDRLIYVADATRPKLAEIQGQNPDASQGAGDAWINTLLQREWSATGTAPSVTAPPAPSSTGAVTTGGPNAAVGSVPTTGATTADSAGAGR